MSEVLSPQPIETHVIELDGLTREQWQVLAPLISSNRVSLASELIVNPPAQSEFDPAVKGAATAKDNIRNYAENVPKARTVLYTTELSIARLFEKPAVEPIPAGIPPRPLETNSEQEQKRQDLLERVNTLRAELDKNGAFLDEAERTAFAGRLDLIEKLLKADGITAADLTMAAMNLKALETELAEALRKAQEKIAEDNIAAAVPAMASEALNALDQRPPEKLGFADKLKNLFNNKKEELLTKKNALWLIEYLTGLGITFAQLKAMSADPSYAAAVGLTLGFADIFMRIASKTVKDTARSIEVYPHASKILSKLATEKAFSRGASGFENVRKLASPLLLGGATGAALYGVSTLHGSANPDVNHGNNVLPHGGEKGGTHTVHEDRFISKEGSGTTTGSGKEVGTRTSVDVVTSTPPTPELSLTSPVVMDTMVSQTEVDFIKSFMGKDAWRHINAAMNMLDKLDHVVNPLTNFARLRAGETVNLFNRDLAQKAVHELFKALDSTGTTLGTEQTLLKNIAERGYLPNDGELQNLVKYLQSLP